MNSLIKEEIVEAAGEPRELARRPTARPPAPTQTVIELSSSDSDSEAEAAAGGGVGGKRSRDGAVGSCEGGVVKRLKAEGGDSAAAELPLGFLDPLPLSEEVPPALPPPPRLAPVGRPAAAFQGCKQFWKAGDFDAAPVSSAKPYSAGMDHVRVHPKFLHSNATSHKWALGALAELLDNSLDEVCNGATYVNIDMLVNKKDGSRMLLIEDNGGGMDPDKVRHCMSLGYSAKCKMASTIGQYGNGFKTSTMRLGADVIVFSRSRGKEGRRPTQSIGMLSYTFLKNTGKEDIVVPMIDYEKGEVWNKLMRSSLNDWKSNLETIVQWSPYSSEADLLQQFSSMKDQGTRVVIYNLWEDEQGELELDFDADKHDIQVRGVNRDEKKIQMAKQFPNSRHFLTYRHSLRSYASILYLRLPHVFRMILRGKEIEHHNIVNDMMLKHEVTYRPQPGADGVPRDPNMVAVVTMGFVKDAKDHIDVQGFNVYHKNRLIKPFWRVWNAAGSGGRGVLGVLEANFIEPAHDKQDFERTTVLSRLEARLVIMQKQYWRANCQKIGYAPIRDKKLGASEEKESSPDAPSHPSSRHSRKDTPTSRTFPNLSKSKDSMKARYMDESFSGSSGEVGKTGKHVRSGKIGDHKSGQLSSSRETRDKNAEKLEKHVRSLQSSLARGETPPASNEGEPEEMECIPSEKSLNAFCGRKSFLVQKSSQQGSGHSPLSSSPFSVNNGTKGNHTSNGGVGNDRVATRSQSKAATVKCNINEHSLEESELIIKQLKDENEVLKDRLTKMESMVCSLEYERDRNKSLTEQLKAAQMKLEEANKEQEALIDIFSEERNRRDREEENLRKKLKDALVANQELREKLSTN